MKTVEVPIKPETLRWAMDRAGLEAESDVPPPQPWSSAFDPAVDGLCVSRAA